MALMAIHGRRQPDITIPAAAFQGAGDIAFVQTRTTETTPSWFGLRGGHKTTDRWEFTRQNGRINAERTFTEEDVD